MSSGIYHALVHLMKEQDTRIRMKLGIWHSLMDLIEIYDFSGNE